jgi:catechol 2,3-dioxygenase-like lactoylglutathione lyase family enzyme
MSLTVMFYCRDIQSTRDFYHDLLRFQVAEGSDGVISVTLEGGTLMFTERDLWKSGTTVSPSTAYFKVGDVDRYYALVKDRVPVAWPLEDMSYGTREFGVRDCNGYLLAFQAATVENVRGVRRKYLVYDADLSTSRFSNVKLESVGLKNVSLRAAEMRDVSLSQAVLTNCDLSNTAIVDAKIDGLTIDGVLVSDLIAARANPDG